MKRDQVNGHIGDLLKAGGRVRPRYLTVSEASELTRLARQTLYRRVCERRIPFTKAGSRLLFPEDKLLAWLDKHTVEPVRS